MTEYSSDASTTLTIQGSEMEVEFELAIYEALENNEFEFEFHGYIIDTEEAVSMMNEVKANRTYH